MSGQLLKISLEEASSNPFFQTLLNAEELRQLHDQNPRFPVYFIEINFGKHHFFYFKNKTDRRGEVVVMPVNVRNLVLLHTKPQFPNGVYRLMSGGININEPLYDGLAREVFEETGFHIKQSKFIGLALYKFLYKQQSMPFISYLFKIDGLDKEPVIQDKTENISGFKWIKQGELFNMYQQLLDMPQDWKDWGLFRAVPHKIFYEKSVKI